jgi:hypothetical protein
MKEKIIENWLDNASERSYQPIFCQYLIKMGYLVVHSTRHNASEHGKDIIAINPAGIPCAFQLKGNPKSRITLDHYRKELIPQLSALTDQAIQHPSVNNTIPHKSYFVTNGRLDEDVTIAITQKNTGNDSVGLSSRNLNVIPRDELLSNFISLEKGLWPSEIEDTKTLLEILTTKGEDLFPQRKFHIILRDLLVLRDDSEKPSLQSMKRRISAAMLMTSICLGSFNERNNHFAIVSAWTQTAVYLISSLTRWKFGRTHFNETINIIESFIADSLNDLMEEVFERNGSHLGEGDLSTDYIIYGWRYTTLLSVLSVIQLYDNHLTTKENKIQEQLKSFLANRRISLTILGECSIPGIVFYSWALRSVGIEEDCKKVAFELSRYALESLPPVYYTAEQILEHQLSLDFAEFSPIIKNPGHRSSSWAARQAYVNMVHLDLFEECQTLWKKFSLSVSREFHPSEQWQFCLLDSKQGTNEMYVPPIGCTWAELQEVSKSNPYDIIPSELSCRPTLLALWSLIAPHRFTLGVINSLFGAISKTIS